MLAQKRTKNSMLKRPLMNPVRIENAIRRVLTSALDVAKLGDGLIRPSTLLLLLYGLTPSEGRPLTLPRFKVFKRLPILEREGELGLSDLSEDSCRVAWRIC